MLSARSLQLAQLTSRHARIFTSHAFEWPSEHQPIESAFTPPASWYTDPTFAALEAENVFHSNWQFAALQHQLPHPGSYLAGQITNLRYLLSRNNNNELHAFHNVCRHHAAAVAQGTGKCSHFKCPYHGWEYELDGRLRKATRVKGIKDFQAKNYGLHKLLVDSFGPFVFIKQPPLTLSAEGTTTATQSSSVAEWLGEGGVAALQAGIAHPRLYISTAHYHLQCNWKVFVENYLDGGMHVEIAHPQLASALDLSSYTSTLYNNGLVSIQSCAPKPGSNRLDTNTNHTNSNSTNTTTTSTTTGEHDAKTTTIEGNTTTTPPAPTKPASYIYLYPNLMVNIYGDWMDINICTPTSPTTCTVTFHYFLKPTSPHISDAEYIQRCLVESGVVQQEDIAICEDVQKGLESPAYSLSDGSNGGRYAPSVEFPMYSFHKLLARNTSKS